MKSKTVVVLGATPKEDRYANKAIKRLIQAGHRVIPVNPAFTEILDLPCLPRLSAVQEPVDTVTLYLGAARSESLIPEILATQPARLIFNPGAENAHLAEAAAAAGIETIEGCTLVMLATGEF